MYEQMRNKASRRAGAEGLINLTKRRAWWTDGEQPPGAEQPEGKVEDLPAWAQRLIRDVRSESAARRVKLDETERTMRESEQARLAEEGRWKELAEKRAAELNGLKPYQERVGALEATIKASNDARIARIPEDMRPVVPTEYPPEKLATWLDANADRLSKRPAPELDAGAGTQGSSPARLSDAELAMAKRLGLTPEQYAKGKQ